MIILFKYFLCIFFNNASIYLSFEGIIRDSTCVYMSSWEAYKCSGLNYEMLVIESLDADTETRRLSPVAVLGDGYLDLINGTDISCYTDYKNKYTFLIGCCRQHSHFSFMQLLGVFRRKKKCTQL